MLRLASYTHTLFSVVEFQYEACHSRGSSCGQSRITRRAYETVFYVEMMNEAYKMWSDLEREAGTTLYK